MTVLWHKPSLEKTMRTLIALSLSASALLCVTPAYAELPLKPGESFAMAAGMGVVVVEVLEVRGQWVRVTNDACPGMERGGGKAAPDSCWVNTALLDKVLPMTATKAPK